MVCIFSGFRFFVSDLFHKCTTKKIKNLKSRIQETPNLSTDADSITAAKKLLRVFFLPSFFFTPPLLTFLGGFMSDDEDHPPPPPLYLCVLIGPLGTSWTFSYLKDL